MNLGATILMKYLKVGKFEIPSVFFSLRTNFLVHSLYIPEIPDQESLYSG